MFRFYFVGVFCSSTIPSLTHSLTTVGPLRLNKGLHPRVNRGLLLKHVVLISLNLHNTLLTYLPAHPSSQPAQAVF